MTSFHQTVTEDRRLSILLVLSDSPGYSANGFLVRDAIANIYGHNATTDQVHTDLAWLTEQQLVVTRTAGSVVLGTLTPRGFDIAAGRGAVPGVKRRGPSHG